MNKVQILIHVC